ncbi:zf-HC2 domain-containing protein, partial [Wenyingzhuangia sp. 1_MG-2023]|nr:zf-HC2 domain-containing protein [Wenyingzhuangia sp. 1_MG-2023]
MMNCREATRLMSEAQERKLSLGETAELKIHTMICAGCKNFGQQMQSLRGMMRSFAQGDDPEDKPPGWQGHN